MTADRVEVRTTRNTIHKPDCHSSDVRVATSPADGGRVGIESISLSRGACYGPCPIYQVTLTLDGTALWHGERFVDREGSWVGTFDPVVFSVLEALVDAVGFFDWDDDYSEAVTDLPQYHLSVRRDGNEKTVRQYATDEPHGFAHIATAVDAVAAALAWKSEPAR
jgi:hypothetical protein